MSDTEIHVAAIATQTNNPTGGVFSVVADGIKAYFKMVNDGGGIYGRKLVARVRP